MTSDDKPWFADTVLHHRVTDLFSSLFSSLQGYATEATKAALAFVFKHLKSNKASLTCDEDNQRAYGVAERCGFVREGCLREQVNRKDGTLVGKLCYGMLRTEFETLYA